MHVDRRHVPQTAIYPTYLGIYGIMSNHRGAIQDRSFHSSCHQSAPAQHREQSNPERGTESSSIAPIVFLLSNEGKAPPTARQPRISIELTPTKYLYTLYCNPLILGALEYKVHQLLDVGHRSARLRINCCVLSVILVFFSPPKSHVL
jgi:hypothetical protein